MSHIAEPAPRDNIIRAVMPGMELRSESRDDGSEKPTLFGHFARFDEWTEIDSMWEGRFMERFAPGSFKKTLRESGDKIRLLFQHGQDPDIGDKPIGAIREAKEDDEGAYYEASLFAGLPELVMDGLRAGQYGASFRFGVVREDWVEEPEASEMNPRGLPERTVREARVAEFGPVTFGAYANATAGVRSLTDDFIMRCFAKDPDRLREMFDNAMTLKAGTPTESTTTSTEAPSDPDGEQESRSEEDTEHDSAPPQDDAELDAHLVHGRRDQPIKAPLYGLTPRKERPSWRL